MQPVRDTQPFDSVLKIAVLRGGGLGDLIFALPAIDALAAAYPEAEIVLLGTPVAAALIDGRPGPIARVVTLPQAQGVHSGDGRTDEAAVDAFMTAMRAEHFDLACQLHGGGRHSNPFVQQLGARHTVGTATTDAAALERTLAYVYYQHEIIRWLETVALAGAESVGAEPRIVLSARERLRGRELVGDRRDGVVVIHPGASDPRRRWPAERFVEVAVRLAGDGMRVVLVGDGADADLADTIAADAARVASDPDAVLSLAGRLSLSDLAGVLGAADVVLGNDSGPRHLAQAVGAPTAGVFWFGNVINGAPLTRGRHRVQMSYTTACPVCGRDVTQVGWTAERCEHDLSHVADVGVDDVYEDVIALRGLRARTARLRVP